MRRNFKLNKIGDSLRKRLEEKGLIKGINASKTAEVYNDLKKTNSFLEDSKMVFLRNGILKIKASSPLQRQEILLKKKSLFGLIRNKGIEAKEIIVSL